ncbi:MAG TPA: hypothetical protein VKR06_00185 [Ktedonosporobacter sp.]|nr:hypothetical protein [Ktedonosporobacter sp.]
MLIADTDRYIFPAAITDFDATGWGEFYVIDAALASLSRLSGQSYSRANVGGIVFILSANGACVSPAPMGALPIRPRLLHLRDYYKLSLYKLLEATQVDHNVLYYMIRGRPVERAAVERVLSAISAFTGVNYTVENVDAALEDEGGLFTP